MGARFQGSPPLRMRGRSNQWQAGGLSSSFPGFGCRKARERHSVMICRVHKGRSPERSVKVANIDRVAWSRYVGVIVQAMSIQARQCKGGCSAFDGPYRRAAYSHAATAVPIAFGFATRQDGRKCIPVNRLSRQSRGSRRRQLAGNVGEGVGMASRSGNSR